MTEKVKEYYSQREIASQPDVWSAIFAIVIEKSDELHSLDKRYDEVIFSGCGSGLNASICGAPIFQKQTKISSRAVPAADVYSFPDSFLIDNKRTLAVLCSRSGQTTEVIHALDFLRARGISTIGITCTEGSPLAIRSNLSFVLTPATEQAVITTRSLTSMILTIQLIAAIVSENNEYLNELQQLPSICTPLMPNFHEIGEAIGNNDNLTKYAFVGNGPFYGIARESQLKVKEMVLLPSDCYPVLDFRHGPQSNVDENMLVTVFLSDNAREEEISFVKDMKALNGIIWVLCKLANDDIRKYADYVLEVNSDLGDYANEILYLPAVQYMAYYRTLLRGLNPDEPRNLAYWIDTSHA